MAEIALTRAACVALPPVCVLTGRRGDIEFQPVTFERKDGVPGLGLVTMRTTLALPFDRAAYAQVSTRRQALATLGVAAAIASIMALVGLLLQRFSPAASLSVVPLVAAGVALVAGLLAAPLWLVHRGRRPRFLAVADGAIRLDLPSDEAALAFARHIERVERERARRLGRTRVAPRERLGTAIDVECPHCSATIRIGAAAAGTRGPCPHCHRVMRVPARLQAA